MYDYTVPLTDDDIKMIRTMKDDYNTMPNIEHVTGVKALLCYLFYNYNQKQPSDSFRYSFMSGEL